MALGTRATKPLRNQAAEYREPAPAGMRLGIALSGGGIRSAAFNLGALQALQDRRVLEHADYLAAVSGGNYVASALAISNAYYRPEFDNGRQCWAHGSVEERYLRQHTNYLAPGPIGRVWFLLNVGYGFALNYLPFLLCAFIAGRVSGWVLAEVLGVRLTDLRFDGLGLPSSRPVAVMLAIAAACVVAGVLLVGVRRFMDGRSVRADYGRSRSEGLAFALVRVAAALVGVGLLLPLLASAYGSASVNVLTRLLRRPAEDFQTAGGRIAVAVVWLLASLALAAVALALGRRLRARRSMLALASLAVAGLFLVPLLSSLEYSMQNGLRSADEFLAVVAAAVVVLYMAICVHNRRYSLHQFYRERLGSAFALERTRAHGRVAAAPIGYQEPLFLSRIGGLARARRLPKLIVCCSVNLTSDEVPVGRFAESFTFEHDTSGGPLFGYHGTTRFEEPGLVPGTRLTLPAIMAVSGAALSPLMGRFTHRPLRFLMAMTNIRLGVWIRNPLHRGWNPGEPAGDGPDGPGRRVARWCRQQPMVRRLLASRTVRSVIDGWREPGALYVLREALGVTKSSQRFICLTDGGHWENLGLVELLRRRCSHVLCFDATSDATGGGLDIGRAIALARSELGVDIDIDPRPTQPDREFSADVAVRGSIRYPDPEQDALLVYARAVLTERASWDLVAYRARDGRFPNHSTSQQIFTDEQFESYRSLGYEAGCRALALLNVPDVLLADAGASQPSGNGQVGTSPVR